MTEAPGKVENTDEEKVDAGQRGDLVGCRQPGRSLETYADDRA